MEDETTNRLRTLKKQAVHSHGLEEVDAWHKRGRKTARERVVQLLDQSSFVELDMFRTPRADESGSAEGGLPGGGVITGYGKIGGRDVYVYSQDAMVVGGALGEVGSGRIVKIMDLAVKNGAPVVGFVDLGIAGGMDGGALLGGYAEVFSRSVAASGVVPQITGIMGICSGEAVFGPALSDFTVMVKGTSRLSVSSSAAIKAATGETVTGEDLGGALTHNARTGAAHLAADDEDHCFELIRTLVSFLPQNNLDEAPRVEAGDPADREDESLDEIVSADPPAYSMREVVGRIVDHGYFFELMPCFAQNLLVGFARLNGRSVGVVANEPSVEEGRLDSNACAKGARFVRFCDAFNLPLVILEDTPGFVPGTGQENAAMIRNGAKLLYAFAEATVPKITVITGKAGSDAYDVMCSKYAKADLSFAWPSAKLELPDPGGGLPAPYLAAQRGYVDDIIQPRHTRARLVSALDMCASKREGRPAKKHGNIPL